MITKTVKFKDLDGNDTEKVLHFHMTKTTLGENMTILDRMEKMQREVFTGERRLLSSIELQELLRLVKDIMALSYGERDDNDSSAWDQSPEAFARFRNNLAYDAFVMELFSDPELSDAWMIGVIPPDLVEAVKTEKGVQTTTPRQPTDRQPKQQRPTHIRQVEDTDLPDIKDEVEIPHVPRVQTQQDFLELTPDEQRAYLDGGGKVPPA